MRWKCRSRRDATTQPPARWSVGGHELRILHSLEETNLLEVVEAAVAVILSIDDLPQQLNRRLRPVGLSHRHVEVVDEKEESLAGRWPKQVLPHRYVE